jgi:hypothetical protein
VPAPAPPLADMPNAEPVNERQISLCRLRSICAITFAAFFVAKSPLDFLAVGRE